MIALELEGGMGVLGPMSEAERRLEVLQSMRHLGLPQREAASRAGVDVRTVRRWQRRYEAEGLVGLVDRPPVPIRQPGRLDAAVERAVVAFAREHPSYGARKLRARWILAGRQPVPSLSTFARVRARNDPFVADGILAPKPRQPIRRFVRSRVCDLWQVDAAEWVTTDGTVAVIIDLIDDHSRFIVGCGAFAHLSDANAMLLLNSCFARHGPPRQLLSDNGVPFTGHYRQMVTGFERLAWQHRVHTIHGAPAHPETQGKIERFHRTLKAELARRQPTDLHDLNHQLAAIVHEYNHHRPHQAIDDITPAMAWQRGSHQRAHPELHPHPATYQRKVDVNGVVHWSNYNIYVGRTLTGSTVTCTEQDGKLFISFGGELLRAVELTERTSQRRTGRTGHSS